MSVSKFLATAVCLLTATPCAFASTIPFTRSSAGISLTSGFSLCGDGGNDSAFATSANCDTPQGIASASANYGRLGASASIDADGSRGAGAAVFSDLLTVLASGAAPNSYVGIWVSLVGDAFFQADGNLTADLKDTSNPILDDGNAMATIKPGSQGTYSYGSPLLFFRTGTCGGNCEMLLAVPFVSGDPLILTMILQAEAFNNNGTALFGDTARVESVGLYDAAGNLIPGATFTSASGTVYPLASPATSGDVPEPVTLLLVGAGVLGGIRRRRRPTQ